MARAARAEQAYDSGPGGYAPAQGYQAGPGYGPPQGYDPVQGYGTAQGYAVAQDYDPEPAYPPAQGYPVGRGNRRLHAVPDDDAAVGLARPQPDFARGGTVVDGPRDQGTAIRQAAEQEAAAIRQRAVDQAEAIRQAAEQEAAQLRAALLLMSDELGRVAAYVTENLANPGGSAARPAPAALAPAVAPTRPAPAIAPGGPDVAPRPDAAPRRTTTRTARPTTRPTTRSPARPPNKKKGVGRQHTAFKATRIGVATLIAVAVTAGIAEFKLHGPEFFVFRQGGTGQTPGSETDQQFQAQQAKAAQAHHTVSVRQGLG